jgi:tRNA 2-selenouridine synthase
MEQAIAQQQRHGDTALHRQWIEPLLVRYYDKMYDYQIANKPNPVLFRGDQEGLMGYLQGEG